MPKSEETMIKMVYESQRPLFAILRDKRQWIVALSQNKPSGYDKDGLSDDESGVRGTLTRKDDGTYLRWVQEAYFATFEQVLEYLFDQFTFKFYEDRSGFEGYVVAMEKALKVIHRIGRELGMEVEITKKD